MIERKFVRQKVKEHQVKEFISSSLNKVGLSDVRLVRTPLGEKILISASRPGLVVGRSGANIARLTREIKDNFDLDNPQIELDEVTDPALDANIIAEQIAGSLERFGPSRFKGVGHRAMSNVMGAGAFGIEILISGKIPSARGRTWRFYKGYLKKCGDIAVMQVRKACVQARLKTGIIGIQVSIMPPDVKLPDRVEILQEPHEVVEEVKDSAKDQEPEKAVKSLAKAKDKSEAGKKTEKKDADKRKKSVKKTSKKSAAKSGSKQESKQSVEEQTKAKSKPSKSEKNTESLEKVPDSKSDDAQKNADAKTEKKDEVSG